MNVKIENLSETKVELTISLNVEALAIAEEVALARLARDMKVPGFRKGKVPIAVAAKNVDPNILQEKVLDAALNKAIADAFIENKIQVLDRPMVDIKKFVPGSTLDFVATAEILPEVKLGNYKKLKVKREKIEINDDEITDVVDRMRKGMAEKTEVGRPARNGDETVIDFVGKKDGVAFDGGTSKDYNLTLGSGQFIPGFEEGVVGHSKGETFDLDLTFPKDYHAADLKGTKVTFTVTLKTIKEVVPIELNNEFAAKVGPFKTVTEMKEDIKRELIAQKEREVGEKLKDELVRQLVEASKVPVPDILVADQSRSIEQDFVNNLMYQGISLDQYFENKGFSDKEEWLEKEVKPAAINRVRAGLVLAELSKQEKIEASSEEIDIHVDRYKQQYANNTEALKQFELPEVRRDIANRLITEKTVERLVELNL